MRTSNGLVEKLLTIAVAVLLSWAVFQAGPAEAGWRDLPVVPRIEGQVEARFVKDLRRSKREQMRAGVFAKVGDSNTEISSILYGFGCREPQLAGRTYLREVIEKYNRVELPAGPRALGGCSPVTSFSRRSNAALSGTSANWSLVSISDLPAPGEHWGRPPGCRLEETPLSCEIRITRPRYTFIMTGTNDVQFDRVDIFESTMSSLTRAVRKLGSVPVLSTLPPLISPPQVPDSIEPWNAAVARVARDLDAPVINLWRALESPFMINRGLAADGRHLGVFPDDLEPLTSPQPEIFRDSVNLRPRALRFGANRRNLIWLKTLKRLDSVPESQRSSQDP
ncbi:MAG: SGNH/GDSL hydrolase family protein [Actinomycetota bacterium]|nr:SGNH/GDSL hydrolase family protein [Actinomycetota bacterium]